MQAQTHAGAKNVFLKATHWGLPLEQQDWLENVHPYKIKPSLSFLLSSGHHPLVSTLFPFSPTPPPQDSLLSHSLCPHHPPPTPNNTPTWFISGQAGSGHGNTPERWVSQQRATGALLSTSVSEVRGPQLPQWGREEKDWENNTVKGRKIRSFISAANTPTNVSHFRLDASYVTGF